MQRTIPVRCISFYYDLIVGSHIHRRPKQHNTIY